MKIFGFKIDEEPFLPYEGKKNTTGYYLMFMNHCIYNYFGRIIMTPELREYFSTTQLDPMFREGIKYNRVKGFNFLYYSTYFDNAGKIDIMYDIASLLGINLNINIKFGRR